MNPATGTGFVTVTDPDGNTTVYDYTRAPWPPRPHWTGTTARPPRQDYSPHQAAAPVGGTLLDTATTDGNGNTTSYTYDAAGDPTSTTAPDGERHARPPPPRGTPACSQYQTAPAPRSQLAVLCQPDRPGAGRARAE